MGYETLIRRAHVMTRKNTLKSLPTDTEFRVVGLDLAKSDVSVAAIPVDDNTPSLVDRMTYADLLDWAGKISPTLFQDRRPTLMMRSRWPDWQFLMPS